MSSLSRRDFLKLSSLALGGLALGPRFSGDTPLPKDAIGLVRVTTAGGIELYDTPAYPRYRPETQVIGTRARDQLLYVYEKFESEHGPDFNPSWYRLDDGYAHTAYLQPVKTLLNPVSRFINPEGELFEVSVPLTQTYQKTKAGEWEKLYRLYYSSTHWVTAVEHGPDGALWYKIRSDLHGVEYYVMASHLRKIEASELTPISPRVDPAKKRVEVSISEQHMWAFEEGEIVLETKVSTGIPRQVTSNGIPSETPRGSWDVFSKMPVRHMGNGQVTSEVGAYELPGVPWVSYFQEWGVAFHGTYWHDNFGNEMSAGCVNMRPEEAKWLFRWLTPDYEIGNTNVRGLGTHVVVT
jgi:lipoprotein-anchoring transpeptidase ErfK/SrfK